MKSTDANRPVRMLQKVLDGGLGEGNLGVILSRHGTGKQAVLTSLSLDKAMQGSNVVHIASGESVSDVRAYRDEILHEIEESYDILDRAEVLSNVERHTRIYTYAQGVLSIERLRNCLDFLRDHADFQPEVVVIAGWPEFDRAPNDLAADLKKIAGEYKTAIWCSVHTHSEGERDERGVPSVITPCEEFISVIMLLEPDGDHIPIRFAKAHDRTDLPHINLELDPKTMLIRWV